MDKAALAGGVVGSCLRDDRLRLLRTALVSTLGWFETLKEFPPMQVSRCSKYVKAPPGARLSAAVLHDDAAREYAYRPAQGLPNAGVGTFSQETYDMAVNAGLDRHQHEEELEPEFRVRAVSQSRWFGHDLLQARLSRRGQGVKLAPGACGAVHPLCRDRTRRPSSASGATHAFSLGPLSDVSLSFVGPVDRRVSARSRP